MSNKNISGVAGSKKITARQVEYLTDIFKAAAKNGSVVIHVSRKIGSAWCMAADKAISLGLLVEIGEVAELTRDGGISAYAFGVAAGVDAAEVLSILEARKGSKARAAAPDNIVVAA